MAKLRGNAAIVGTAESDLGLVAPDDVRAEAPDVGANAEGLDVPAIGELGHGIGRVIESPQDPGRWEGLDLGLSWRTPWRGQLSVGAENVVTRGRNPFAPRSDDKDEGAIPYVRYQQDL